MIKRYQLLFVTILSLSLFQSADKAGCERGASWNGIWTEVTSKDGSTPEARHEAAFVSVGDQLCLIGGRGMKPTSIFNTETEKWTNHSPPPIEIHHLQPVVYQDKIYIMGALTGKWPGETPIEHIYIYDPKVDKWEQGSVIPNNRNRGAAGVVLYQGKMYMVCGIRDGHRGDHKNWLDVYDPQTEQWAQLQDAPRARDHFQAIVANNQLFVVGGRRTGSVPGDGFGGTIGAVDVYDFKSNQWKTLENDLPTFRAGNYAILVGDEILVIGGESPTQEAAHAETEALHTKKHTWRTLSPMLAGRHGTGVVRYENKLFVASGSGNRGGGPELNTMECLKLNH